MKKFFIFVLLVLFALVASDVFAFSCGQRKTCGKMDSCKEAYYHLKTCGNKRLDRDKDGIPCESICG